MDILHEVMSCTYYPAWLMGSVTCCGHLIPRSMKAGAKIRIVDRDAS